MHLENIPNTNKIEVSIDNLSEHAALITAIRPNSLLRGLRLAQKLAANYGPDTEYPQRVKVSSRQLGFISNAIFKRMSVDQNYSQLDQHILAQINDFNISTTPPGEP